jgi:hypothetical protein
LGTVCCFILREKGVESWCGNKQTTKKHLVPEVGNSFFELFLLPALLVDYAKLARSLTAYLLSLVGLVYGDKLA